MITGLLKEKFPEMKRFALLLACCLILNPLSAGEKKEAPFLKNGVTAHRGNSSAFPENTLPAFESGIAVGADWLELDIFLTKDGKLVVTHDKTTQRVGDKILTIADSTYDELKTVDVATDFRKRHQQTKQECPPQQMPLLEDVLKLVKQQHRTRVSLQPKADCVKEAVALVKQLNMEPWVGFNDGNLNYMTQVKQMAPRDFRLLGPRRRDRHRRGHQNRQRTRLRSPRPELSGHHSGKDPKDQSRRPRIRRLDRQRSEVNATTPQPGPRTHLHRRSPLVAQVEIKLKEQADTVGHTILDQTDEPVVLSIKKSG